MCAETVKRSLSDLSSPHAEKKVSHEITSIFGRLNDFLKYRIIWYNKYHENPLDYYKISSKFRRGIVDYLECFISLEKCQQYIQSLINHDNTPIILIISIYTDSSLEMIDFDFIHSVYIHQEESDDQRLWPENMINQEKV